jgi:hypothetical protein
MVYFNRRWLTIIHNLWKNFFNYKHHNVNVDQIGSLKNFNYKHHNVNVDQIGSLNFFNYKPHNVDVDQIGSFNGSRYYGRQLQY